MDALNDDQLEEVFREANALACIIEETGCKTKDSEVKKLKLSGSETVTIQRTASRLNDENEFPVSAIKRKLNDTDDFAEVSEPDIPSKKRKPAGSVLEDSGSAPNVGDENENLPTEVSPSALDNSSYSVSELEHLLSPLCSEKSADKGFDDNFSSMSPLKQRVGDVKQLSRALCEAALAPLRKPRMSKNQSQHSESEAKSSSGSTSGVSDQDTETASTTEHSDPRSREDSSLDKQESEKLPSPLPARRASLKLPVIVVLSRS